MRICLNCNHPVDDDAEFCDSCGSKLEKETEVVAEESACPNCEQVLEDAKTCCTNCGEEGNKEEVPLPKNKMSPAKLGMIAVAGVVVVGLAIFFVASGLFSNPANKFLSYQRDFATKQVAPYIQKSLEETKTFSTDMVLTAAITGANGEEYNQYLQDSAITMKVDMQEDSLLANTELKMMGSTLLQATFTYDEDLFGFYLPELDSKYYTVDFPTMMKELGSADFSLKKMQETQESYRQICKEFGKLYLEVILGEVNKNNVSVTDKEKVELTKLGKTVKGMVYTYKPSQEDIKKIIIKLCDSLEKNTELKKYIINAIQTNENFIEDFELKEGQTIEEAVDQNLKEGISDMRNHAEEWSKNLADQNVRWSLGVSQGRIVQQCLMWGESDAGFGYESDGTADDGRHDVCYASDEGEVFQIDAQWKKANGTYSGEITMGDNEYTYCEFKFDNADPEAKSVLELPYGNYHLSFEDPDLAELSDFLMDITIQKGSIEGTDHIMHLQIPSDTEFPEMDITLHTTDKKSTAEKPSVEASKISSFEELSNVVNAMSENLGGLLFQIMGSM